MTGHESKRAAAQDKLAQPAQEQLMSDQINYGMSVTQGGRRIDPMSIYKEPEQEPVAVVVVNQSGGIRMEYQDGSAFDISKHVGQRFYTTPPQPAQEPVAWMVYTLDGASVCVTDNPADFTPEHRALPLYTIPPQRKPLTQDGTMEIANQTAGQYWMDEAHIQRFRAAVEAAHGIKE